MKLYVYQPDGHGPDSMFVCARSPEEAVHAMNLHIRNEWKAVHMHGGWHFTIGSPRTEPQPTYAYPNLVTIDDLQSFNPGHVVTNANE